MELKLVPDVSMIRTIINRKRKLIIEIMSYKL